LSPDLLLDFRVSEFFHRFHNMFGRVPFLRHHFHQFFLGSPIAFFFRIVFKKVVFQNDISRDATICFRARKWTDSLIFSVLITTSLIFFELPCFAQSAYRFRHFDNRDGLASEAAYMIRQDSLGFIWTFNTDGLSSGALTRFDGFNFKVYNFDPSDSLSSPGGWIDRIEIDRNGNLWVFRFAPMSNDNSFSMVRYDPTTDSFRKIRPPLQNADMHSVYAVSFEKDEPIIWISGTNGAGIFKFNFETNELKNYKNLHPDAVTQKKRNSNIVAHSFGRFLLMTTEQGIWRFDKATEKFSRPKCDPKDSALFYHPSTFSFIMSSPGSPYLDNNDLWVVFFGKGMVRIDSNFTITNRFKFPEKFDLQSLDRDKDKVIWIASHDGIYRYDPKDSSLVQIRKEVDDPFSLATNEINDLVVDRDQNIWVATSKGISVLKKQDLTFYNHKIDKSDPIETFEANGTDFLLVTKRDPVLWNDSWSQEIYIAPIVSGHLDNLSFRKVPLQLRIQGGVYDFVKGKSDFWVASYASGITRLPISPTTGMIESKLATQLRNDPKNVNSLTSNNVLGMLEDHGNLWVSSFWSGVNKIALNIPYGEDGSVTRYEHAPGDSNSVANNLVFRFFPADEKSFWVNTKSGIDLFHDGRFEHVSKEERSVYSIFKAADGITYLGTTDGLYASRKDNYPYKFEKDPAIKNYEVLGIHEDKLNRLWLSNHRGTMMYDPKENLQIEFTEEDGINHAFENMERTTEGFLITTDIYGVTIFDPLSLNISSAKTYPVLTRLLVNNRFPVVSNRPAGEDDFIIAQDIVMLKELVIDYKHNNFMIEFLAMQMTAPKMNLYQYKLEGYDDNWIQTDWKNRTATYTNLDADNYVFRVKASNHHGVWSDQERTLSITVLPPPWKTAWAYTGYGLLLVGILFLARRNIVQRERLKSRLKMEHLELEKAQEVDRMKTSFFTNISHEFRTPLTLIKGPAQNLVEEYSKYPKVKESAKVIQHNADLLLKLINQLMNLAKLESGSLTVEKTEVDLNSFLNVIASSFSSLARQKDITFNIELPQQRYRGTLDLEKTETILINLLGNAMKFTPAHGQVNFNAEVKQNEPSQQLEFIVSDTGVGIAAEEQQKIFDRFYQVNEGSAHHEIGTGIGLALVKELTGLLGGKIELTSQPGKGSEFCVTLPFQISAVLEPAESNTLQQPEILESDNGQTLAQKEAEGTGIKPSVLVVEDNADLRKFIIESLGKEYKFFEAADGRQGVELAIQEGPELIISDIMMPEMDGITMTDKIRKDLRTSHIPIIILTAKATEENKLVGLVHGADDYLTKPFNKSELSIKVRNAISSRVKIRQKVRLELLSEAPKIEAISEEERFLTKLKEVIQNRLTDEQLSVESLAEEIGFSRAQFYRKVTALTGRPVNELIRDFRLQKAKQLLDQHWGSVSQVAYEVGFSNPSYFSKCFKDQYGVLPSEYSPKMG